MFQKSKNAKVFAALSGGLDSAGAAALLKKQGYQVKGIFMKLNDLLRGREDEKKAKKIAAALRIPFAVWDFRKEFQKRVVNYFLKEYRAGRTPNPCVVCNEKIKFGLFLKKALVEGANFIATGHYVKKSKVFGNSSKIENWKLEIAADSRKDQSYFLWRLKQKQLSHILFPLGGYTKPQVKKLVRKLGLPVAGKESQDICFIPTTIRDFLSRQLKARPGKIINTEGKIIGEHPGIFCFTVGQRCGSVVNKTDGKSYYVVGKNYKKNILVAAAGEPSLRKKQVELKEVNFIGSALTGCLPCKVLVRLRYRQPLAAARLIRRSATAKKYRLFLERPQPFATPGQSAVFYNSQGELLGGGIIEKAE